MFIGISGPSGVGKSTVVSEIKELMPEVFYLPSFTTRRPRSGESQGNPYFFVSRENFNLGITLNWFVEYNEHYGNLYGIERRKLVGAMLAHTHVIKEIEPVGALSMKSLLGDRAIIVYLTSEEDLALRLDNRCSEDEYIKLRLDRRAYEDSLAHRFDLNIINKDPEETAKQIITAVKSKQVC